MISIWTGYTVHVKLHVHNTNPRYNSVSRSPLHRTQGNPPLPHEPWPSNKNPGYKRYIRTPNGTITRNTSPLRHPGAQYHRTRWCYHTPWPTLHIGTSAEISPTSFLVWRTHQNTYHRGISTTQALVPTTTSSLRSTLAMAPHLGNGHMRAHFTTTVSN